MLLLADDYPTPTLHVSAAMLDAAAQQDLRLYVEYPASLADLESGKPRSTLWERLVIASDFFTPALNKLSILALHGCWYLPMQADTPHMVVAKVAGYREAVYGLPQDAKPILFEFDGRAVLVSTSKLSQFVTGRYGPIECWQTVWQRLLRWLTRSQDVPSLVWEPTVRPRFGPDASLGENVEHHTFKRAVRWYRDHILFLHGNRLGALEGFSSHIDAFGNQLPQYPWRADCSAETAMVLAADHVLHGDPDSADYARRLLEPVFEGIFMDHDPDSDAYGHINWFSDDHTFWGDDNARVILAGSTVARWLNTDRWDEPILRCLLANLRTTGPDGFRRQNLKPHMFAQHKQGWRHFRDHTIAIDPRPHFQAYLWACNIRAYAMTGYDGFMDRTMNGIRYTMEVYPNWQWTNGLTQEMARMILPLAFLLRVEDTAEHRQWLDLVVNDLLAQMHPSGMIHEKMGDPAYGTYPSPRSNDQYGSAEASVIQTNGNPAGDLNYTLGFALLGLHEAAAVTRDAKIHQAADRLTEFLCPFRSAAKHIGSSMAVGCARSTTNYGNTGAAERTSGGGRG